MASWRRLSDQLERVRADLADRINESLADASDSMLERIPDSAIDSVTQTHIRSRAVNAWLGKAGRCDARYLREKASMPTFISDGARGLALAARRVVGTAPSVRVRRSAVAAAGKRMSRPVPSVSLSRRDLRFFNAFPPASIATKVSSEPTRPPRPRPRAVPTLAGTGTLAASLLAYFPFVSRPLPRRFQDCGTVGAARFGSSRSRKSSASVPANTVPPRCRTIFRLTGAPLLGRARSRLQYRGQRRRAC